MPSFATFNLGGQKSRIEQANFSTANTARDGTGTIADLVVGSSYGTTIHRIELTALGTTTPGVIRVFLYNGTGYKLIEERLVSAIVPSATVEVWSDVFTPEEPIKLPNASWKVGVSTHNAESFSAVAHGNDA